MSAFFILIGFSLLVAGGFLVAFLWGVRSGQYDDDYTPSVRLLFDDDPRTGKDPKETAEPSTTKNNQSQKTKRQHAGRKILL